MTNFRRRDRGRRCSALRSLRIGEANNFAGHINIFPRLKGHTEWILEDGFFEGGEWFILLWCRDTVSTLSCVSSGIEKGGARKSVCYWSRIVV